jgi:hypothetical protein
MRRILSTLALLAVATTAAGAQQMDHSKMMGMHASGMKNPCPLHLTTLNLSAAQQIVFDSLKKEHEAGMKTLMAKAHDGMAGGAMADHKMMKMSADDHAAMEKSMKLTIDAVRAILTNEQRATFDAAVTAHEAEMKAMMEKGGDCMACCMECMGGDMDHAAMHKKPEL